MSASITSKERTEDQVIQARRMFIDLARPAFDLALKKIDPDRDGMQQFIGNGKEIESAMRDFAIAQMQKHGVANQFVDEEATLSYAYSPEYKWPKPIEEQIKAVATIYRLDPTKALAYAKNLPELPDEAEGWFAIPSPDAIAAKHFPKVTNPAKKYCRAVLFMFAKMNNKWCGLYNDRDGQITADHLRIHTRTAAMLEKIAEMQNGSSILIIAAQVGLRHRRRSVRQAREAFMVNEFGLTSLMVGTIALTHPERYLPGNLERIHTDIPGDEFAESAGVFAEAPYFEIDEAEVEFGTNYVATAYEFYRSASGFLPQ